MTESNKCWSFTKNLIGVTVSIGIVILLTASYFNYFVTPGYRKTADYFLKPHSAALISQMKGEKAWVVSSTQYAKRFANKKALSDGMIKYNSAATLRNAYIEMLIATFDTGLNDDTFKRLNELGTASDNYLDTFTNWVSDRNTYASQTDNAETHEAMKFPVSFEVLGDVPKVASEAGFLKESIREQRVKRMINNLRSCQLPSWEEINIENGH